MGDTKQFQSNPYASFDVSQWSNPYSLYQNQALPWPSSYVGTPTNAMGQPIATPQGMTLNSAPAQPQAAPQQAAAPQQVGPMTGGQYGDWRGLAGPSPGGPSTQAQWAYNLGLGGLGAAGDINPGSAAGRALQAGEANAAATPPAASASGSGQPTSDYNTALAMLANPGNPTTPGATVPQGTSQPINSNVLQSFMQNWKPQQSGAGSGFQQNFYGALKGMGY